MSLLFALMLASSPTTATAEPAPVKKPRMRCEYVSEIGSNRPRRVCQKVQPKPEEAARETAPQVPADGGAGAPAPAKEEK
jgi:hypothetical protein